MKMPRRPELTYRDLVAWLSLLKEDQLDQPVTMLVKGEVHTMKRLRIYEPKPLRGHTDNPLQPYMDFDSDQDYDINPDLE